jgi:cell surface protein SprA
MADFIGGTVGLEVMSYSFRSLNQGRSGSVQAGSDRINYSANGNVKLDKFVPDKLGMTFPISVNYSKSVATPRLLTYSDIVLTESRQNVNGLPASVRRISSLSVVERVDGC